MELRERNPLTLAFAGAGFFWLGITLWLALGHTAERSPDNELVAVKPGRPGPAVGAAGAIGPELERGFGGLNATGEWRARVVDEQS